MNFAWKISTPALPPRLLHREQLSQVLSEALGSGTDARARPPYRLVLLCAPAGYGKTTLLVDTIQRLSLPCRWLILDRADQQPLTFLTALLASVRDRAPNPDSRLDTLLRDEEALKKVSSEQVIQELVEVLATETADRRVLVLCNYQEVNDSPSINELVNQLLKALPPQCLLVIESRALPDLELASLIAHGQIFGLGSESLRFSAGEVYAFAQLQNVPAFTEEEATQIVATFDGWIAGMLLASRLGTACFEVLTFPHLPVQMAPFTDRRHLLEFIVSEVFRDETAIYTLLKETSLLDQLIPAFCDTFLKTSNSAVLLERAEHQGLFVMSSYEAGKRVYRCHPVLRALFQEELRQYEQETFRALHQRIAALYYQMRSYEASLSHAREAQAHELVVEILLEAGTLLLDQGQSELVLQTFFLLPAAMLDQHPPLLLLLLSIYLRRGQPALVLRSLRLFPHLLHQLSHSPHAHLRAQLALLQGQLALMQGDYPHALVLFEHALQVSPADHPALCIRSLQHLAICSILNGGPLHRAIAQLQQALLLCHSQREEGLAGELHHQLANAYMWTGNYTAAEHHRHYIRVLQERPGQTQKIMNNLIGVGLLKMRQGLVEEAVAAFQRVLELIGQSPRFLSSRAYALVGFGELALTRRDTLQALRYLQEALDIARQLEDRYLLNDALGMLALAYLQLDASHTARSLLDQMVLQAQETQSYESIFRQLIYGTVLLAEQRAEEAEGIFEYVARVTGESGIQWLQVQALLRRAMCGLTLGWPALAREAIQQVQALNKLGNHDYCIQGELQTYPLLRPLLQEEGAREERSRISVLSAERLCICALGEPAVVLDGKPVTGWRRARALELFFLLLESKQPLRKDRIISLLWPEAEEDETLNQTFRSTVYCVRQALDEKCVVYQSGLYRLNLQGVYGQFWYDVDEFEACERTARAALEEKEDQRAEPAYQKMIDLYRGKYLEAFYSDWCAAKRDALHQAMMEAHQQLALIAWRREEWEESLQCWQHILTLDPCLEAAHYGIMRCYLRQGKRELALRQYQRCRRELHEQLGVEPGSSLQKLYQRLANAQG